MMMHEERESAVVLSPHSVNYDHEDAVVDRSARSLWAVVDNRLRGHWRFAFAAGIVVGTLLGIAAYFSTVPKYQSAGFIRVAPIISPILQATPETGLLPLYQSFVQTQAQFLASRRVLDKALEDDTLASLPWAQQPNALRLLERQLLVQTERGTELIGVRFTSASPEVSQAVVNAVIRSYDELHGSRGGDDAGSKLQILRQTQEERKTERLNKRSQIQDFVRSSGYGATDVGQLLPNRYARLDQIEYEIEQLEEALALTPSPEEATDPVKPAGTLTTIQQLDAFDPQLADLRRVRNDLRIRFEQAKIKWKPTYQAYIQLEEKLRVFNQLVADREEIALSEWEAAREQGLIEAPINVRSVSREDLENQLRRLTDKAAVYDAQIRQMITEQFTLASMQADFEDIERRLSEVTDRIKGLQIEQQSGRTGRITIAAWGERPLAPFTDRRRKLAAVGVLGGFALTFGLFFFIGTIDRRAYVSAQVADRHAGLRCLGVLPDMRKSYTDEHSCAVAAHCAHQIRNHIEATRDQTRSFVLAVSSPYQGDGKTSIAISLGWSYASAGHRTVLVDCDITGQSLTVQLGCRGQQGLKDVLHSGRLDGELVSLTVPNLSLLPAGVDVTFGPEAVRKGDLQELFAQLRARFDVILVDTGPLLASLEALPVASAADAVLLSVRRGRRRSRLDACIKDLEIVGAACLGVVLNCAAASDCYRYASGTSLSRSSAARVHDDEVSAAAGNGAPLGASISSENAIVRAMESASRHSRPDGCSGKAH